MSKISLGLLEEHSNHWNDRRSRRVFLCFYSAIFQLTSAKFQTFAYHSRTIRSSCMKFWQQFEIIELYIIPNCEAIGHVTSVLESETAPQVLRKKRRFQSKTALVRQKIFHLVVCLKTPFHPNQPTFGRDEVHFVFFFLFFLPNFCTLFFS